MSSIASKAWAHKGCRWIFLGWSAFIAENLVISHNRDSIINQIGDSKYHLMYSSLSTAACLSIAWGYFKHGRRQGPLIKAGGLAFGSPLLQVASFTLQSLGLVGLFHLLPKLQSPISYSKETKESDSNAKLNIRCPIDFKAKDDPTSEDGIYGLTRVSRHANFFSLGLLSAGAALRTPFLSEFILFSFPLIFAFIGGAHQDYRFKRMNKKSDEFYEKTSLVPFYALVTGKQSWSRLYEETKLLNSLLAVLLSFGLAYKRTNGFIHLRTSRLIKNI